MLDALDKKIIAMLQEDLPLVARPYLEIANTLGISEEELLDRLKHYREAGQIRKIAAVLRHREVGFSANALCAWVVPDERIEEVGRKAAMSSYISHCYSRKTQEDWPYNFYTMLHGHSPEECKKMACSFATENDLTTYVMLFSTREWKKTSMRYFQEDGIEINPSASDC
ncbi:hypothetical protein P22_0026 [Propionispora sp. 2/2-37]|uniref:siroheme decarboxylase subunit beta n=1 Tax=Propionispora sp. 2/2-37 TaxID=1677858 RepID=UPI0006BB6B9F|nr:AsnC family transcriptional regulator [Propionispora sp. 2/2-37]CUH93964.1 hypothetical protein P22_0026 [Propionispora sp. 2/2-37]